MADNSDCVAHADCQVTKSACNGVSKSVNGISPTCDDSKNPVEKEASPETLRMLPDSDNDHISISSIVKKPTKSVANESDNADYLFEDEYSCGLASFRPSWLQKFGNKNVFLLVFSISSLLQGMYYPYFASILTTLEKLYHIQSKTTGIIMSATEIGQISSALLLTYYGSNGHRPKLMGFGMLVFVVACFLCTTPHFIYQSDLVGNIGKPIRSRNGSNWSNPSRKMMTEYNMCNDDVSKYAAGAINGTTETFANIGQCNVEDDAISRDRQRTNIVLSLLFVSLLMVGTGYTAVQTLGIPYIDDNVAPRESPLYFGMTMGVKIFGPVLGFMLGSLCTSIYIYPFNNPGIDPTDHAWVGAWWLGILIIAVSLLTVSLPMMSFPRKLKITGRKYTTDRAATVDCNSGLGENGVKLLKNGNAAEMKRNGLCKTKIGNPSKRIYSRPKLREFPKVMHRLLGNKILIWRTASSVLHILPIAGLYTFMPKYLESQFRMTAAKASMIAGLAGMLVMGVGILTSSIFMRKYKPTARFVAGWIAVTALAYSIGMVILSFIGCNSSSSFHFTQQRSFMDYNDVYRICNRTCACDTSAFSPVCSNEGITYVSLCHAGCSKVVGNSSNKLDFGDCSCLEENSTVSEGYCELECDAIFSYILIFTIFVYIHSTSEVGMMLLTLRCVDPADKTMALGLITFSIGLFGNVPCPIIYGAVVDSTCQFWEDNCGQVGACKMYDSKSFRQLFHGVTAGLMFLAFIVDVIVWFKAGSISFPEYERQPRNELAKTGEETRDESSV